MQWLTQQCTKAMRVLRGRRFWLVFGFVLIVGTLALLLHPHTALAQDASPISLLADPSWWVRLLARIMLYIAQLFIRISLFFLAFIIQISAYNGYLDSTTVNVGWVMVRDITNMFFVVMLLLIAFGTILGIEQYEWKKTLVKFVMAAILVNFSRVICGVLIDASQIVMNTFVNGIVATAGGNLINMFNLNGILRFHGDIQGQQVSEPGVLTATVAALVFAGMLMMTLAIFVFMLAARLVRLWILIVLSPMAFVLSATPLTQKYSGQWWSEFGDDLVTGPVLLFFIWLSFVSLGNGDINKQIAEASSIPDQNKIFADSIQSGQDQSLLGSETLPTDYQSAGISDALRWNSMANFAIAIGMLMAGAFVASQIGGSSGSALSAVGTFGKKVATIATGYAAGRWLYDKGSNAVVSGVKAAAWYAPVIGGEKWKMRFDNEVEAAKGWYYGKALLPKNYKQISEEIDKKKALLGSATERDRKPIEARIKELEAQRDEKQAAYDASPVKLMEDKAELDEINRTIAGNRQMLGSVHTTEGREKLREELAGLEKQVTEGTGKGILAWAARSGISLEKNLKKTKQQAEKRKEIAWKTSGSKSGGRLFMQSSNMRGAQDRIERGWLQAEEMRSHAKDEEGENMGKFERLRRPRFKDGQYDTKYGSMADQIDEHEMKAHQYKSAIERLQSESKLHLVMEPDHAGHMTGIDGQPITYSQVLEEQALAKITKDKLGKAEELQLHERMAEKFALGLDVDHAATRVGDAAYGTEEERKAIALEEQRVQGAVDGVKTAVEQQNAVAEESKTIEERMYDLERREQNFKDEPEKFVVRTDLEDKKTELEKKRDDIMTKVKKDPALLPQAEKIKYEIDAVERQLAVRGAKTSDLEAGLRGGFYEEYDQLNVRKRTATPAERAVIETRQREIEALAEQAEQPFDAEYDALNTKKRTATPAERAVIETRQREIEALATIREEKEAIDTLDERKKAGEGLAKEREIIEERQKVIVGTGKFTGEKLVDKRNEYTEILDKKREHKEAQENLLSDMEVKELFDIQLKKKNGQALTADDKKKLSAASTEKVDAAKEALKHNTEFESLEVKQKTARGEIGEKEALAVEVAEGTVAKNRAKERLKEAKGDWGKKEEALRNGDVSVAREIHDMQVARLQKAQAAAAETATTAGIESEFALKVKERNGGKLTDDEKKQLEGLDKSQKAALDKALKQQDEQDDAQKEIVYWEKIDKAMTNGGTLAWSYGATAAKAAESSNLYRMRHNTLLSDAEQRTVMGKRGIKTPNNALPELMQEFEKKFSEMSYDDFVKNAGETILVNSRKINKGEKLSEADKAAMAGLFKRGFNESWIDDIIIGVMKNKEASVEVGKALGWKDMSFSADKVGDAEMLMATGNTDFVKKNVVIRELLDAGLMDFGMDASGVIKGMKTGDWRNAKGDKVDVSEIQTKVQDHLKELNRELTEEQQKLFDTLMSTDLQATDAARTATVDQYLNVQRDNQAQLQFFGNLRNEAIKNNHAENSGWSLSHDVGNGEQMYIASGARMARSHAYSDLNKTDARLRTGQHPHTVADLAAGDEFGQVATGVNEANLGLMRNGVIDSRSWAPTTGRYASVMMGVSSADNLSTFRNSETGHFDVGFSKNAALGWKQKKGAEYKMAYSRYSNLTPEQVDQALTARNVLENVMAPQMRTNVEDFLLTAANASGVNSVDAITKGTMRLNIPYIDAMGNFRQKKISTYGELRQLLSSGKLGTKKIDGLKQFSPKKTDKDLEERIQLDALDDAA